MVDSAKQGQSDFFFEEHNQHNVLLLLSLALLLSKRYHCAFEQADLLVLHPQSH